MAPRRASIASTASGTPRRSSRPSISVLPTPTPKKSAPASAAAKRSRETSVAGSIAQGEEGADSATPSKKRRVAALPVSKKRRAVVTGINAIPALFPVLPPFTFEPAPVLPSEKDKPRTAFVFGDGGFGQHGLGADDKVLCEIKRPRIHAWFEKSIEEAKAGEDKAWEGGIAQIECGGMHTLAVDGEGKVWSWGINDNAALGRNTSIPGVESEELETKPMLVQGLQDEDFKAIRVAAGDSVSLAISDRGELRAWGSFRASEGLLGFNGQPGSSLTQLKPTSYKALEPHTVIQIATGDDHFVALTTTGHVFTCGNGEQNQLGRKITQRHKENGLAPTRLALRNIVLIGSGSYHSFAVDTEGLVYAWGLNSFRQTGVSSDDGGWEDIIATPTLVESLSPDQHGGARVVAMTGGVHHSLFLFSNGQVWACGRCDGFETGLGAEHPAMVESKERETVAKELRRVRREQLQVELEAEVDDEGGPSMNSEEAALKAAEAAAQGVPLPNPYIPLPTQLSFPDSEEGTPSHIISIAAGTRHNFAVSSVGQVFAWGVGNTSQLGLGAEEEVEVPTRVKSQAMEEFKIVKASTGGQHSVVVGYRA